MSSDGHPLKKKIKWIYRKIVQTVLQEYQGCPGEDSTQSSSDLAACFWARMNSRARQMQQSHSDLLKMKVRTCEESVGNSENKLRPGSQDQGFLTFLGLELMISHWHGSFISSPWAGPSVSGFFLLIWRLRNCRGVRCMMGVVETTL